MWIPLAGDTGSTLTHLEGSLSGATAPADAIADLDSSGRPYLPRYDLAAAARTLSRESLAERRLGGLWRWHEILPVRRWEHVASLGEGGTPLLEAGRLGQALGLDNLALKAESLNPTGSFKARGMAVAVSRAVELGVRRFVAPSAGNAAGALAAYAAAAGATATLVMPADAPRANQVEVLVSGANLVLLDGLISDCGKFAKRYSEMTGAFDMSTLKEPYRVEGKKTMGLELAEDLGWELPDAILYPTGGGTGLVGMWKAFDELEAIGLIGARRPRMYAVQAEGCAPIVNAFDRNERFANPVADASTRAAGIRVPSAVGDFLILDAIRASAGAAIAVPEHEIESMQAFVAAHGAGFLSLETAAAVSAIPALLEQGKVSRGDGVVVFDTGAGFKSEPPINLDIPATVPNDPARWDAVVEGLTLAGSR